MSVKTKLKEPFDLYEISRIRPYLMGIATMWVAWYHCKWMNPFYSEFLIKTRLINIFSRLEATGNCGVDLFFFLSGLGLYFSLSHLLENDPHPLKSFYRRRYRRILPTILIVTILTYGFIEAEKTPDLATWAGQTFLYGYFIPDQDGGNFWFFSFIVILYLIYPLIHRVIQGKHGAIGALVIILAAVTISVTMSVVVPHYYFTGGILWMCRIPIFVMGAYMGKLCLRHQKVPTWVPVFALPLSMVLLVFIIDFPQYSDSYFRFYEFFPLVLMIALWHAWIFSKFRKRGFWTKFVMMIGSYSMEIYLIFETIYNHSEHLINSPDNMGFVYALTAFTGALVLGVILKAVVNQLVRVFDAQGETAAPGKKGADS